MKISLIRASKRMVYKDKSENISWMTILGNPHINTSVCPAIILNIARYIPMIFTVAIFLKVFPMIFPSSMMLPMIILIIICI